MSDEEAVSEEEYRDQLNESDLQQVYKSAAIDSQPENTSTEGNQEKPAEGSDGDDAPRPRRTTYMLADQSPEGIFSNMLHFITIYNKNKTVYLSEVVSEKYRTSNLNLTGLMKSLADLKMQKLDTYRTSNSMTDEWTSIYLTGGMHVSALFSLTISMGERIEMLGKIKKVIGEVSKQINLATNHRVITQCQNQIREICKVFNEQDHTPSSLIVDRDLYMLDLEELMADGDISQYADGNVNPNDYPAPLKLRLNKQITRFEALENFRAGRSKTIVIIFMAVMAMGVLLKLYRFISDPRGSMK